MIVKNLNAVSPAKARLILLYIRLTYFVQLRVGYDGTSFALLQKQQSVNICVTATSPGIETDFSINITTATNVSSEIVKIPLHVMIVFLGVFLSCRFN